MSMVIVIVKSYMCMACVERDRDSDMNDEANAHIPKDLSAYS